MRKSFPFPAAAIHVISRDYDSGKIQMGTPAVSHKLTARNDGKAATDLIKEHLRGLIDYLATN
jgi:hypothetical protein